MGTDRRSAWPTVLFCLCLAVLAVAIVLEVRGGSAGRPAAGTTVSVVTAPATEPGSVVAVEADSPSAPAEPATAVAREREREGRAAPATRNRTPYVAVRDGAEVPIRSKPRGAVVASAADETEFGSPTVFSVDRIRGRWFGVTTPELPNGRLGWVRADPSRFLGGYTDFRIAVDLSDHEARLWRGDELLRRWPVTVGSPATPTPTGRFSVTDVFRGGLNPAYGCCAVALTATQPHLPTGWSGGNRIAFHGTDGALGTDGSTGCLRSRDRDVRALVETVPLGTPVTIRA
ncbi:MAG: L,D-transpeptidase [Solirubrobacterales bacterium]